MSYCSHNPTELKLPRLSTNHFRDAFKGDYVGRNIWSISSHERLILAICQLTFMPEACTQLSMFSSPFSGQICLHVAQKRFTFKEVHPVKSESTSFTQNWNQSDDVMKYFNVIFLLQTLENKVNVHRFTILKEEEEEKNSECF